MQPPQKITNLSRLIIAKYRKLRNLELDDSQDLPGQPTLAWVLTLILVTVILSVTGLVILLILTTSQPKQITGINYYQFPVTVQVEDQTYSLEQFHLFNHQTRTNGEVHIKVRDQTGEVLQTNTIHTTSKPGTALVMLSRFNPDLDVCTSLVDVTELFYPLDSQPVKLIKNLNHYDESYTTYFEHDIFTEYYDLLAPGTYSGDHLPNSLSMGQKIFGIYVMECNDTLNPDKLTDTVKWWTNYLPSEQQELYKSGQAQIQNTPEYSK